MMNNIEILISGDFCPVGRNREIIKQGRYESLFNGFEKIVQKVDYAVVNFECPLTESNQKIKKTGPCLKTDDLNAMKALQFAGFDLLTLANNHIQDYGSDGVMDTIDNAKKLDFDIVGSGKNRQEASKAFVRDISGIRVGFINIAENEFCAATDFSAGANTFDLVENIKAINDLKGKTDKIILIFHGGREHYQLPTPNQRKNFRFFIDCGVDAVVAHHTHCVSGYEFYNDKPIVYSLGNFIFDYKKKYQKGTWTEGMSVILRLASLNSNFEIEIIPHKQGCTEDSTLKILSGKEKTEALSRLENLNTFIVDDEKFHQKWRTYVSSQKHFYLASLFVNNKYVRAFFIKGLLPSFILDMFSTSLVLNLLRCETHNEIAKSILTEDER